MAPPKKPSQQGKNKVTRLESAKKRTSSSRRWLLRQLNDPFVAQAKKDGYRSRAAFKLIEIDDKFHILKPGAFVVDLGAAPGGWSQVCAKRLGPTGTIVALDLQEIAPLTGVTFFQGDFTQDDVLETLLNHTDKKVDAVLSDMAAPACGMQQVDHTRIMVLLEQVFDFCHKVLTPGGAMVAKVLRGGTEHTLLKQLKKDFTKVVHFKPQSSRQDSAEMFVVCLGFRPQN
jgi:23S rRNA (uridine2552-2'-O)-methyltransferase